VFGDFVYRIIKLLMTHVTHPTENNASFICCLHEVVLKYVILCKNFFMISFFFCRNLLY